MINDYDVVFGSTELLINWLGSEITAQTTPFLMRLMVMGRWGNETIIS